MKKVREYHICDRCKKEIDFWRIQFSNKEEEIERLNNIINEVREYIEKRQDTQKWRKESLKENSTNLDIVLEHYRDILEILKDSDKE